MTEIVTIAMKLGGTYIALHELLLRKEARPIAIAEAAFMMAGARLSKHTLLAILDRIMGRQPAEPDEGGK